MLDTLLFTQLQNQQLMIDTLYLVKFFTEYRGKLLNYPEISHIVDGYREIHKTQQLGNTQ